MIVGQWAWFVCLSCKWTSGSSLQVSDLPLPSRLFFNTELRKRLASESQPKDAETVCWVCLGGAYCKLTAFSEDLIWFSSHPGAPVKVQIPIASCVALSDVSVAIPCFGTLPGSWINRRSVMSGVDAGSWIQIDSLVSGELYNNDRKEWLVITGGAF